MKHIFWLHSHTAFYSAISVIKLLDLKNVLFLSDRGYRNKYFPQIIFNDFSKYSSELSPFKFTTLFSIRYIQNEIDERINELTESTEFCIYIPQLSHPLFQILITNKLCKSYNFLEEGIANYNIELFKIGLPKLSFIKRIIVKVINLFLFRIQLNHTFFGKYKKLEYSPKYFLLESDWHIKKNSCYVYLKWEKHPIEINIEKDAVLFIISPLIEYGLANQKNYYHSISQLLDYLKENIDSKHLYLKFHPYQSATTKNEIELLCSKKYHVKIIPSDEPVEQIILNIKEATIIGHDSSLLLYARILNHKARIISAYKNLCGIDHLYREKNNAIFLKEFFSKSTISI